MSYDLMGGAPSVATGRRRATVASTAPTSSWDVPSDFQPADGGYAQTHAAGSYGSSGDPLLDTQRDTFLADASARQRGARQSALDAAPNDPSAAAFASLSGMIHGQSDAAHGLNALGTQFAGMQNQQAWQEHMDRLEAELRQQAIEAQNKNAWIGDLAQLGGTLGGAYLGRG